MKTSTIALASSLLLACGGGGAEESIELITADEGGTIEVGGGTSIDIPAEAVSEDTEVTIRVASMADYEAPEDARDLVLEFEPVMALEASASVTLDPGNPTPTPDQFALLYQFVDGDWFVVDTSTVIGEDGLVHSGINLLAPTAVVIQTPEPSNN